MAKVCQNCGKGVMVAKKVARARQELLYRSPKVYKPNLHTAHIAQPNGTKLTMTLCTKCLRMVKQYTATQLSQVKKETKTSKSSE